MVLYNRGLTALGRAGPTRPTLFSQPNAKMLGCDTTCVLVMFRLLRRRFYLFIAIIVSYMCHSLFAVINASLGHLLSIERTNSTAWDLYFVGDLLAGDGEPWIGVQQHVSVTGAAIGPPQLKFGRLLAPLRGSLRCAIWLGACTPDSDRS